MLIYMYLYIYFN